ncbi:hypothetical protein SELMODRAFT_164085 [Selaginella moellendorffii]|uniref:Glutathione reductase n=1 Tax=Selaginella moellendorffii TaxID=88036 RepID=D8QML3_SELML|nr:glutathione reductase, cytosolic [Selaginella moellendorffii]EFJ37955.1 hypothetical protein SELMODRAFT_164085 [Selaginella moellendorffii]|eukprot:XP_002960416.1 glutathione reductase, cytosolic [Selaginella moellendorffii]
MAENGAAAAPEEAFDFDLFTIGAGSGGVRASRTAANFGAKVAVVELPFAHVSSESAGGVGGTCVIRGCVPKKILVYASMFSAEFQDSKNFGWNVPDGITFEWKRLIANKDREIERLNGIYKRLLTGSGVTILEGRASLVDDHTVEVSHSDGSSKRYRAKHILVATGSRAVRLNVPGKELAITSDEGLNLDELPRRCVIVGGGYIAVEFAGIYSGMGSKVELLYRKKTPLRGFDDEMRAVVARNLENRGVHLRPDTNVTKIEKVGGELKVSIDNGGEIMTDAVLFAVGRKPKTSGLNLEELGVELDKSGAIKVDEYSRSSVPSVWAIGDVTNRINLTPVALMEGTCFAKTAFGGQATKPDHENVARAVFCQPPLAVVGLSEEEAVAAAKGEVAVYSSSFTPMKNTISGRQEKSVMKLLVDTGDDRVLGVAMCGPDAPEIMQGISVALKGGATKAQFDSTVGIHPTAAEEFVTMRSVARFVTKSGEVRKP